MPVAQQVELAPFMWLEPMVSCERIITPGYVAQWLGWVECAKRRLRIQYATGVGVEPLNARGAEVWTKRERVAGAVLRATLLHGIDGLVLTASYRNWSFRSQVRDPAEAQEVLDILRTLHGQTVCE